MSPPWARLWAFVALFAILQTAYISIGSGRIERFVIEQVTVGGTALLLNWFDPDSAVVAQGARLSAPGGGLYVRAGCEGTDVALLLSSALLVANLPWRQRLLGVAAGLLLVFVLNQLRMLALFHAYRHHRHAFELLHGTLLPLAMVLVAGAFYLVWVGRAAPLRR
jgi:exosortase/archaeosortase family protein